MDLRARRRRAGLRSEWDVVVAEAVVELLRRRCRRGRCLAPAPRRRGLARPALVVAAATAAALVVTATATLAALASAAEHLHLVGDDVGAVALDAVLAGVLVGAQRAFDIDLAALLQVFAGDLRQAAEELDPVPLGAFLHLAGLLVLPRLGGGHADRGDGAPALGVFHVGVVAEVADEDDLVDATGHGSWFLALPAGIGGVKG